ncbi:coiled-coil domain-containing protein 160 homolog [Acanthaster planci]|uniref:Coiled-coil domain-containing protein 160 homolog n=1 Tax=Acanthaster planci TaxID=133434 RepID=A0A8B7ZAK3_ACAPL|nr:coiled-coil domain-containing protein 160 homolog [Acanthaster planci]XP_022101998.1 coiled-coil domain-containing protein 160 homolog [Acanthaster planci]XP_022101999.1 coiled-coil domain-containing protein 160 homolog [Acanthaster planci]
MEKHWVEDLFPPFYTYTLDQDENVGTTSPSHQAEVEEKDDNGEDLQRIQRLYDRVRIQLNHKHKESRQKCIQVGEPLAEHLPPQSPSSGCAKTSKEKRKTPSKTEEDECLWTAKELQILRTAAEAAKQENARLNAELSITGKQKEKLARRCKQQSAALEAKDAELLERKQETERLSLCCHHLETELGHSRMTVKFLEEDIGELRDSKRRLKKQLKDAERELSELRLEQAKLQDKLLQVKKGNALESIVREDGIRLDYERQIKRLYEELEETRTKLEKQKKENGTMRKALDHLRIHFASLPSSNLQQSKLPDEGTELRQLELF